MKKVYQVLTDTKAGFLIIELLVSMAVLALCSSLIAHWYMLIMQQEKKITETLVCMNQLVSCMNAIKVQRVVRGTKKIPEGTLLWDAIPFGAALSGQWITLRLEGHNNKTYSIIFGIS